MSTVSISSGFPLPSASYDPLSVTDPLGGYPGYGFNIPSGDPGAVESAGSAAARLGQSFADQARWVQTAARVAVDGAWRGSASGAFSEYSGALMSVLSANAGACQEAAGALRTLADSLNRAQQATRQALTECEQHEGEMNRQNAAAQAAGEAAQTALRNEATAPHPARAAYHTAYVIAQGQQSAAQGAASAAANELAAAKTKGHQAWESYIHEARALGARISAAADRLRVPPTPAGGAPAPIAVSPREMSLAARITSGWAAGKITGPLIEAVPISERTPGLAYALLQSEGEQVQAALHAGGARGPYSLWTSAYFGNSAATVNSAVAAGLLPPMPSNWGSMSGIAGGQRGAYLQAASKFYSGITCEAGACSMVKVTGTGTANASQVLGHLTQDAAWTAVAICVVDSGGSCAVAGRFVLASATADNAASASSPVNFLEREGVTAAAAVAGGGPLFFRSALAKELEGVLPQATFGRLGLNAFFTGPQAGVTLITPKMQTSLFPPVPHPAPHVHHGHR